MLDILNDDKPFINQSISYLWLNGREKDWNEAEQNYYRLIKPDHIMIERKMEGFTIDDIKKFSNEQFYDFLYDDYFFWRYTAPNRLKTTRNQLMRYKTENRMKELITVKEQLESFDPKDILSGLEIVGQIRGLGVPGASGLLAILFPNNFGSVDQFAIEALKQVNGLPEHNIIMAMKPESLKPKDAAILISIMRSKAKQLNIKFNSQKWSPRIIDKILWANR